MRRVGVFFLAAIGTFALLMVIIGLALDVSRFDQTSGGYEYPYEGWTGTPIDYEPWFTTHDGMYQRGRVIDLYVNCTTGMVSWSFLGINQVDWRQFSDRAKVVHQPQVACRERGFDTAAWEAIGT